MKKTLLLGSMLLALSASIASAAGLNLSWNDCGTFGAANKTFACNVNTGSDVMWGSYVAPEGTTAITGNEMVLDLQSAAAVLPAWWQFKNPGSCRQTSLSAAFAANASGNCGDYWSGQASGGLASYNLNVIPGQTNRARVLLVCAVDQSLAAPLTGGSEYYSFSLTLNHAKTVGTGSCAGCTDPVCIVLNEIKLTQPVGVGDYRIQNPASRNYVTYQSGLVSGGCPAVVPAQNRTWGQVKSLYR